MRNVHSMFLLGASLFWMPAGGFGSDDEQKLDGVRVGTNFRIHPSTITQSETFITRHPADPSLLFASANTINLSTGFISEGIYVSTDAGLSWTGSDTCQGAPITFHGGDPGIAIDKDGTFILIRLSNTLAGLYSHNSTDNGMTWSSQRTIVLNDQDRATLASDGFVASSHYGRSYAAWVQFAIPYPVFVSFTDDGGNSWSTPEPINNPPQRCQGGEVAIGSDGSVNITWASVIPVSPFTEDYAGYARSTDGGVTWTILENAFDMNGIVGTFPEKANIRVNGLPRIAVDHTTGERAGWIYVVTGEKDILPAGSDPDVLLHRSTDNGASWSGGIRVNQDGLNNGKFQYFPAVHVDDSGGVNVLYYDDRTTTSDSATVFLSRSTDGGASWTDYEVSDHHFKPLPIGGLGQGYQGDNIDLTSTGTTLWPVWMDNSSGLYQIWTCPIDINDITSVGEIPKPSSHRLQQNYPNPFNPRTEIAFEIGFPEGNEAAERFATLKIYDLLGQEVSTLVSARLSPGTYVRQWDATGQPGGVYFYRLSVGKYCETRKLILLK